MAIAAPTNTIPRELARRSSGELDIILFWDPVANSTSVEVYHLSTEETIVFPVALDQALDAFHHPFAHLG